MIEGHGEFGTVLDRAAPRSESKTEPQCPNSANPATNEIEIHEDAESELGGLRPHDRNRVLDEIEGQLTHEPGVITKHKKVLEALEPPWDQLGPVWQLSVSDYRVFYDIVEDDALVIVRAVRKEPAHRRTRSLASVRERFARKDVEASRKRSAQRKKSR